MWEKQKEFKEQKCGDKKERKKQSQQWYYDKFDYSDSVRYYKDRIARDRIEVR